MPIEAKTLVKRTWCYCQSPKSYDVAPCDCGNQNTQWSEFQGHLWCAVCAKDFVPEHNGIFDGPILAQVATMMGICFDRIDLATGTVERFALDTGEYSEEGPRAPPPATDLTWDETTAELEACKQQFCVLHLPPTKDQDELALQRLRLRCIALGDMRIRHCLTRLKQAKQLS